MAKHRTLMAFCNSVGMMTRSWPTGCYACYGCYGAGCSLDDDLLGQVLFGLHHLGKALKIPQDPHRAFLLKKPNGSNGSPVHPCRHTPAAHLKRRVKASKHHLLRDSTRLVSGQSSGQPQSHCRPESCRCQ